MSGIYYRGYIPDWSPEEWAAAKDMIAARRLGVSQGCACLEEAIASINEDGVVGVETLQRIAAVCQCAAHVTDEKSLITAFMKYFDDAIAEAKANPIRVPKEVNSWRFHRSVGGEDALLVARQALKALVAEHAAKSHADRVAEVKNILDWCADQIEGFGMGNTAEWAEAFVAEMEAARK